MMSIKSINDLVINKFSAGCWFWADVTHIDNHENFFVRPTSYRSFMCDLEDEGDSMEASQIKLQQIVIFHSQIVNRKVRGKVWLIKGKQEYLKFGIYALDYGFFEKSVHSEDIYQPENDVAEIPPLAIHCGLPIYYSDECKDYQIMIYIMKGLVVRERAKVIVNEITDNKYIVDLMNSNGDISSILKEMDDYPVLQKFKIMKILYKEPEEKYNYKTLHVGDQLHVVVLSGVSWDFFFVAENEDLNKSVENKIDLTHNCKYKKPLRLEEMKKGKPIAIPFRGVYERAIIRETLSKTKAIVQLVDMGIILPADITQMKSISNYIDSTAIAIYCSRETEEIGNDQLYPGVHFMMSVKKIGRKNSPNIVNMTRISRHP